MKSEKVSLSHLLPQEVNGWRSEGKDKIYDPQSIFEYIDGAGEVYRSYNFKQLLVRRFLKEGQPDLIADVFDMTSSKDAYGVFTHDLEGDEPGIGQGSTYKGGLLSFWKDRFFVSLYAEEETAEVKDVLHALGMMVASSIKKEGEKPDIISFLPQKNLAEKGIHYFHNHMILNYHFYVSDENILLLDQQTEAAFGAYRENETSYYLLLVRYPEIEKSAQAYINFLKAYMPDALEEGIVQTEDKKWTAARSKKDFLLIIFNAPSGSFAKEMIGKLEMK